MQQNIQLFDIAARLRFILGFSERGDTIHNGKRIVEYRMSRQIATKKVGLVGKIPHDFRRTAFRNLERAGVPWLDGNNFDPRARGTVNGSGHLRIDRGRD